MEFNFLRMQWAHRRQRYSGSREGNFFCASAEWLSTDRFEIFAPGGGSGQGSARDAPGAKGSGRGPRDLCLGNVPVLAPRSGLRRTPRPSTSPSCRLRSCVLRPSGKAPVLA
eukprot:scaffold4396_cov196-Pinguiococcus_pyrenoidosus.AAC.3